MYYRNILVLRVRSRIKIRDQGLLGLRDWRGNFITFAVSFPSNKSFVCDKSFSSALTQIGNAKLEAFDRSAYHYERAAGELPVG